MTADYSVCRLCCDIIDQNEREDIGEDFNEMLQTILIKTDLAVSVNRMICNKCHEKLVANYNFKRKCIFTEDSIKPFVSENVKLNLKELRSQIIKSENTEDDKNVCRLCLTFVNNDMTLSDWELVQFQQFFPEIDLSRTDFVILCSTCYDFLYKYFIFVTSCLNLRQPLYQTEDKVDITERHIGIKIENFQVFMEKEQDKQAILNEEGEELGLNEELDIKCETEVEENGESHICEDSSKDRQYFDSLKEDLTENYHHHVKLYSKWSKACRDLPQQDQCIHFNINSKEQIFEPKSETALVQSVKNIDSNLIQQIKTYKCENCTYEAKRKYYLVQHIQTRHTDPSKIKMYKCENCTYEAKRKDYLVHHIQTWHTDPSKIKMYKCENCLFETKRKFTLNQHVQNKHSDCSKIRRYKCESCTYEAKQKGYLVKHVQIWHTDPSKIKMYECENCLFETMHKSNLIQHVQNKHSDCSKIRMYKCEHCTYDTNYKANLARHVQNKHSDPSNIEMLKYMYKCGNCTYKAKKKINLIQHVQQQQCVLSKMKMYKCKNCTYESKDKSNLNRHIQHKHSDPSKITIYKCDNCIFETKWKRALLQHIRMNHSDSSQMKMYTFEHGIYEAKHKHFFQHRHSIPSKIKMYKCENCTYEGKLKSNLIQHVRSKHSDPFKMYTSKCENVTYEPKQKSDLIKHIQYKQTDPSQVKMYVCKLYV